MDEAQIAAAKIRQAASELFAQSAAKTVSVARICQKADLGNGSFFYAVDSKRALVSELYTAALMRRDGVVRAAFTASPADAQTAIKGTVSDLVRFMISADPQARHLWPLREASTDDRRADPDGMIGFTGMVDAWMTQPSIAAQLASRTPLIVATCCCPRRATSRILPGAIRRP
jgi:AcrR family transcriptional regulator